MVSMKRLPMHAILLVTLVAACPVHAGVLHLSWTDNATNEAGFIIERSPENTGAFAELARVGSEVAAFSDVTAVDGNVYCYRVRAFNGVGVSDFSNVACAVAPPTPVLPELTLDLAASAPTMVVTATLVPGTAPVPVDAYIVLEAPDGSLHSLVGFNSLIPGIVPIAPQLVPVPFTGEVFRYVFSGSEPNGPYRWLAGLLRPGTFELIGNISEIQFAK